MPWSLAQFTMPWQDVQPHNGTANDSYHHSPCQGTMHNATTKATATLMPPPMPQQSWLTMPLMPPVPMPATPQVDYCVYFFAFYDCHYLTATTLPDVNALHQPVVVSRTLSGDLSHQYQLILWILLMRRRMTMVQKSQQCSSRDHATQSHCTSRNITQGSPIIARARNKGKTWSKKFNMDMCWYWQQSLDAACKKYMTSSFKLSNKAFLQSSHSNKLFMGTQSQVVSFGKNWSWTATNWRAAKENEIFMVGLRRLKQNHGIHMLMVST